MPATQIRGPQVLDKTIQRNDLDDGLPSGPTGNAVIRKLIQGTGISLSSTGFDAGTGDVTISTSGVAGGDVSGPAASVDNEVVLYSGTTGKVIKRASGTGLAKHTSGVLGLITDNSANWDTAFADRNKWDGGATGLVAATGRTSLALGSAAQATAPSGAIVGTTDVQTLTNKRINPRVNAIAAGTTAPTPNADTDDICVLVNTGANMVWGAPTGTPVDGQILVIRIEDNGTVKTIGWNAAYDKGILPALPTSTIGASKFLTLTFQRNADVSLWKCIDYATEGYASLQAAPTNPTGITGTTQKMYGLGGTCKLTPTATGKVLVTFAGNATETVAGGNAIYGASYGTGTAPANGAAGTGTSFGNTPVVTVITTSFPIVLTGLITGLVVGTAYWFDVAALGGSSTSVANFANISFSAVELS